MLINEVCKECNLTKKAVYQFRFYRVGLYSKRKKT